MRFCYCWPLFLVVLAVAAEAKPLHQDLQEQIHDAVNHRDFLLAARLQEQLDELTNDPYTVFDNTFKKFKEAISRREITVANDLAHQISLSGAATGNVLGRIARAFLERDANEEAAYWAERCLADACDTTMALSTAGYASFKLGDSDKAIEHMTRLVSLEPDVQSLTTLGTMQRLAGSFEDAYLTFSRAVALPDCVPDVYTKLIKVSRLLSDGVPKAVESGFAAIDAFPSDPDLLFLFAESVYFRYFAHEPRLRLLSERHETNALATDTKSVVVETYWKHTVEWDVPTLQAVASFLRDTLSRVVQMDSIHMPRAELLKAHVSLLLGDINTASDAVEKMRPYVSLGTGTMGKYRVLFAAEMPELRPILCLATELLHTHSTDVFHNPPLAARLAQLLQNLAMIELGQLALTAETMLRHRVGSALQSMGTPLFNAENFKCLLSSLEDENRVSLLRLVRKRYRNKLPESLSASRGDTTSRRDWGYSEKWEGDYAEETIVAQRLQELSRMWVDEQVAGGPVNIIIGIADGYGPHALRIFAESLRRAGSKAEVVLFMPFLSAGMARVAADLYISPVIFSTEEQSAHFFGAKSFRFELVSRYLRDHGARYAGGRVLLCDVRDIYFQFDPFERFQEAQASGASLFTDYHLLPPKVQTEMTKLSTPGVVEKAAEENMLLEFFLEEGNASIGSCGINNRLIKDCWGSDVLEEFSASPVICSGATLGFADAVRVYCDTMVASMFRMRHHEPCMGRDQRFHLYVFYTAWLMEQGLTVRLWENDNGAVYHMGRLGVQNPEGLKYYRCQHLDSEGSAGRCVWVPTGDGDGVGLMPATVHQYDRIPSNIDAVADMFVVDRCKAGARAE